MKKLSFSIFVFISLFFITQESRSESFAAGDLSYTCLGGNNYLISFAYYQDCSDSITPLYQIVNFSCSSNSSLNFTDTLYPIMGTGQEVTPGCACDSTTCIGGTAFGVREFIFQGQVVLPTCNSWKISASGCCRNHTSVTYNNTNWYIESELDNSNAPCNSSPYLSNKPISICCLGSNYCFNHGALDPNGDSLVYSFSSPMTTSTLQVPYIPPNAPTNFILSSLPITIDPATGDICFSPISVMSGLTGVKIEEWRTINGVPTHIGTTYRNIHFRVKPCANSIPLLSGIDTLNTHHYSPLDTIYSWQWSLGDTIDFDINGFDADSIAPNCSSNPDKFSISWNQGIPDGNFSSYYNKSDSAYAHFHWIPTPNDVSSIPHCFTATIYDGACPYSGINPYSYCIKILPSTVGISKTYGNSSPSFIYPNPAKGTFVIDFQKTGKFYVELYTTQGQMVFTKYLIIKAIRENKNIDVSYLEPGIYILRIHSGNYEQRNKLILVK